MYQRMLFPAPATNAKIISCGEIITAQFTDVSHVATRVSSGQNVSTLRKFHHGSTISRFRCVEIHVQCCGSSRGLEERATFVYFVAILHLQDRHINFLALIARRVPSRNNSRLDLFRSFEIFCNSSTGKSGKGLILFKILTKSHPDTVC